VTLLRLNRRNVTLLRCGLTRAHLIKAALMGAGEVIAVDRSERRLALADHLAAAHTVLDGGQEHAADAIAAVRDLTGGEGADVVVNATGIPGSFASALAMVRDGGTVLEVGAFVDMGAESVNPAEICGRNLTIMGTGGEDLPAYPGTLALLTRHRHAIPFADMVSHRFAIADAARALETSLDADHATKVLISDSLARAAT
jgi:threonine dehydrogenase-like Zn-dependent dehydrogenase